MALRTPCSFSQFGNTWDQDLDIGGDWLASHKMVHEISKLEGRPKAASYRDLSEKALRNGTVAAPQFSDRVPPGAGVDVLVDRDVWE